MSIHVFNDDKGSLFSTPIKDPWEYLSGKDQLFGVTSGDVTAGIGQYVVFLLSNPSGSNVNIYLQGLTLATITTGEAFIILNGTAASLTTLTPNNFNTGSSLSAKATAGQKNGSNISGGSTLNLCHLVANSSIQPNLQEGLILAPGNNLGVSLFFGALVGGTAAVSVIWSEKSL